ncbi:c-type cytochrome [Reichenbachiella agarivorans]|uniref:C-type cytochrome n=1 Tax=Reichenbachiella agarivorans TaxID=2979464 RepID=A0ABY6CLW2_9BACT|nr:cytochrome c peroxidase [Reichenbachiella agarivorans]UXP31507.1 c-type cytochrome [Reichenbachiella agarivorans]
MRIWITSLGLLAVMMSCDGGEAEDKPFGFEQPPHFPDATYTFDNNPVTQEGFELGKFIFNDPLLSRDSTVSCASCHDQRVAFADPQHRLSIGIDAQIGTRNAPPIFNLAFVNEFFWDGGVTHVDFVPLNPIANPVEMDQDIAVVIEKMQASALYQQKFALAFGEGTEINSARMLHALSQFMVMMVSANSPYDQYLLHGGALGSTELRGLELFENHCATCHEGNLFTDRSFRNNGLDAEVTDVGRYLITQQDEDLAKFKVPSLRNIALTAPYMHDGRFETLEAILEHYNSGVQPSATLDPLLQSGGVLGIHLTKDEQTDIIAFLQTLTDEEFVSNPLFFAP